MPKRVASLNRTQLDPRFRSYIRCQRGSNAVEFALIAPVLCLLLLGICYVSIYLSIGHSLAQIAADASRHAVAGLDRAERKKLAIDWASSSGPAYGFVDRSRLTVEAQEDAGALHVTIAYDVSYLPVPPIVGAAIDLPSVMRRSSIVLVQ